jgi:hypothetical protein
MVLWSRPKLIGANGEKESEVGELLSDAGAVSVANAIL